VVKTLVTLNNDPRLAYLAVLVTLIAGLIFDLNIALGVAGGVTYILPVLFTLNIKSKNITYLVAIVGILLTVLGFIASPEGGELWKVLTNRALAVLAIISVAIVVILIKNKNDQLSAQTEALIIQTKKEITANKVKSRFLSAMSHELRTPLNVILGFSKILKLSEKLNPDDLENVDYIDKAGEQLLKMIETAISFSDIRDGDVLLEKKNIEIIQFVDDHIEQHMSEAKQKNIDILRKQIPGQTNISIQSDPELLREVLQIILDNAITYNYDGGHVIVTVEKTDKNTVKISVDDTGHGISDERHNEVFNPFARLRMANSDKLGLGLGLAKAKLICDILAIEINYRHKTVGTLFWLDIPMNAIL
jgi:signal transduction histidine kinase